MPVARVLLVDDNEADNVFHELVLREASFTGVVEIFDEAAVALEVVGKPGAADQPTLILLDINMPGMDGWEFARAVEPLLQDRPVAIVILTSSASDEDRGQARSLPVVRAFLTKPLQVEVAQELLSRNWERSDDPDR